MSEVSNLKCICFDAPGTSWSSRDTGHCAGHIHHHEGGQEVVLLCHLHCGRPRLSVRRPRRCAAARQPGPEDHAADDWQVHD